MMIENLTKAAETPFFSFYTFIFYGAFSFPVMRDLFQFYAQKIKLFQALSEFFAWLKVIINET